MSILRSLGTVMLAAACFGPRAAHAQPIPPVYAVLFTHIEDQTPGGSLGTTQSRNNYIGYRDALLAMGTLAHDRGVPWSLQPDWKILEAALLYEDGTLTGNTNGKNFLRYLKEDLGAVIDPHSHEGSGYNYTDVAHLLESLGVGGSTVIGGHVWDPDLPQFQEWDRYRVPVAGLHYPGATWRGDILMGSGTPNHFDDPVVSGVWRPRDRDHYFEDDPAGNIAAIGQYSSDVDDVVPLRDLYRTGDVPLDAMLTISFSIRPSTLVAPGGLASIEDTLIDPLVALRDSGEVALTDFSSLIATWHSAFASRAFVYDPANVAAVGPLAPSASGLALAPCAPNPVTTETLLSYSIPHAAHVRLAVHDVAGRRRALVVDEVQSPGVHVARWRPKGLESGAYFVTLREVGGRGGVVSRRLVVLR